MERDWMRIEYGDDDLRRLAEDPDCRPRRLGRDVIVAYRKKIQILDAAKDERDLLAMRSLRLEQLAGDRAGTCSIRLNDQFRLILTFYTDDDGRVVVVLELVDYH
jgi:proteic killer suppression protein